MPKYQGNTLGSKATPLTCFALVGLMTAWMGCNCRSGGEGGKGTAFDAGGTGSEITKNHGHELVVPPADFIAALDAGLADAGKSHTYSIRGKADHDHTVVYTDLELKIVSQFNSSTHESSTTAGHSHEVTLDVATGP